VALGADRLGFVRIRVRLQLRIDPVAVEHPGLTPVAQADVEDLPQLPAGALREHGRQLLRAPATTDIKGLGSGR